MPPDDTTNPYQPNSPAWITWNSQHGVSGATAAPAPGAPATPSAPAPPVKAGATAGATQAGNVPDQPQTGEVGAAGGAAATAMQSPGTVAAPATTPTAPDNPQEPQVYPPAPTAPPRLSVGDIQTAMQRGIMSEAQARAYLAESKWAAGDIDTLMALAAKDKLLSGKELSASEITNLYAGGHIGPTDAVSRLVNMGYSNRDASSLVEANAPKTADTANKQSAEEQRAQAYKPMATPSGGAGGGGGTSAAAPKVDVLGDFNKQFDDSVNAMQTGGQLNPLEANWARHNQDYFMAHYLGSLGQSLTGGAVGGGTGGGLGSSGLLTPGNIKVMYEGTKFGPTRSAGQVSPTQAPASQPGREEEV